MSVGPRRHRPLTLPFAGSRSQDVFPSTRSLDTTRRPTQGGLNSTGRTAGDLPAVLQSTLPSTTTEPSTRRPKRPLSSHVPEGHHTRLTNPFNFSHLRPCNFSPLLRQTYRGLLEHSNEPDIGRDIFETAIAKTRRQSGLSRITKRDQNTRLAAIRALEK